MAFFMSLMQSIPLIIHGKEQVINFLDSTHFIMFNKTGNNVLIKFGYGHKEESSKMPYKVTNETTISFDEFIKESFRAVDCFINKLININPKLSESDELNLLTKERDKAKKAINQNNQK